MGCSIYKTKNKNRNLRVCKEWASISFKMFDLINLITIVENGNKKENKKMLIAELW